MELNRKIVGGLAGLVLVAILGNMGTTKRACETYQGWTRGADGEIIYVFDPTERDKRSLDAQYPLVGDHKLRNSLNIGQRYCFEFKDPIVPWASKRLISVGEHKD